MYFTPCSFPSSTISLATLAMLSKSPFSTLTQLLSFAEISSWDVGCKMVSWVEAKINPLADLDCDHVGENLRDGKRAGFFLSLPLAATAPLHF